MPDIMIAKYIHLPPAENFYHVRMSLPRPTVISINCSTGGIPKRPVQSAKMMTRGLAGDGHNHEKHNTPLQAISLIDIEDLDDLRTEGFDVFPGATGENLTVRGLNADELQAGDHLRFSGGVEIELTKKRKPCFVLDAIDPRLKEVIAGRCGFLAKVIRTGEIRVGEVIEVKPGASSIWPHTGAILAGGQSSRMGTPKQGLRLPEGLTMIEHVLDAMKAVCNRVVIAGSCSSGHARGCVQVADLRPGLGPLSGIEALLASHIDSHYLICPCDVPLITPQLLKNLTKPSTKLATVLRIEGRHEIESLPARIRAEALPTLQAMLDAGERSVWRLMDKLDAEVIKVPAAFEPHLHNVNTLDDWGRVECVLRADPRTSARG